MEYYVKHTRRQTTEHLLRSISVAAHKTVGFLVASYIMQYNSYGVRTLTDDVVRNFFPVLGKRFGKNDWLVIDFLNPKIG
jgi:hypothetical protein